MGRPAEDTPERRRDLIIRRAKAFARKCFICGAAPGKPCKYLGKSWRGRCVFCRRPGSYGIHSSRWRESYASPLRELALASVDISELPRIARIVDIDHATDCPKIKLTRRERISSRLLDDPEVWLS